jgi:hypothetical protein
MATTPFTTTELWLRIYDKRIITEQGIYAENAVPLDYAGPELEIEFNQIMIFMDSSGTFTEFAIEDNSDVMDMNDNKGIGYTYKIYGVDVLVEPVEPATLIATWYKEVTDGTAGGKAAALHLDSLYQRNFFKEDDEPTDTP